MFTNTSTPSEPFSFEQFKEALDSLPKRQEFWSWSLAPSDKAYCFENARSKVTICHPDLWAAARGKSPELFANTGPFGVRIIDIHGDSEFAKECRDRFAAALGLEEPSHETK